MKEMFADTISRDGIAATYKSVKPYIRETPVIEAGGADFGLGSYRVSFKLESLQHAGSFKTRGAFTNLLANRLPQAGVVAASGGNHGVAVAYAAMKLGVKATIFVPSVASPAKIEQIRSYGADLVVEGELYADALAASESWGARSGALPIHAYDQVGTLLGQGTVGLEIEKQAPDLDTLLVAVGGGGLIGGIAEAAPTLYKALEAGKPVDAEAGGIAADSLAPRRVGALMFPIAKKYVSGVTLVTDDEIRGAQDALWRVLRIVAEPGGAAAFAALFSGRYRPEPQERVGVLVCGANTVAVDFNK
jgi:threonine dehydratase